MSLSFFMSNFVMKCRREIVGALSAAIVMQVYPHFEMIIPGRLFSNPEPAITSISEGGVVRRGSKTKGASQL